MKLESLCLMWYHNYLRSVCTKFVLVYDHSVNIHLWRLQRCIIGEIWKIHWKSTIKKYQYCFTNIYATKARIFMKFYVVVNYYLACLSFKFHDDWCINDRTWVVKARAHVLSQMRALTTRSRTFMNGSSWNFKLKLTR